MADPLPTTVLLADQPGVSRTALASVLADTPGVTLVAKLAEPGLIESAVREMHPDVVIVDDRLLRDGHWTRRDLGTRLIVVGVDNDPGFGARARRMGAEAWVPKERADAVLPLLLTRLDPISR
jgi:DNA-binding NarL/FixJ family response regulator